jgi:hypothetical protein
MYHDGGAPPPLAPPPQRRRGEDTDESMLGRGVSTLEHLMRLQCTRIVLCALFSTERTIPLR